MSRTKVVFYKEDNNNIPYKAWLDAEVSKRDQRAAAKCAKTIEMLRDNGSDLRRPYADYLRDGIYELRAKFGGVNYRLLYFFHEGQITVVSHGLTKEAKVPPKEIDLAVRRKLLFESDPERHTYEE